MLPSPRPPALFLITGIFLLLAGCGAGGGDAKKPHDEVGKKSGREEGPPVFEARAGLGYQPRACGFDLDDDGIAGEPEDCRICDGKTADPDGDGVEEDLIYLDAAAGKDARSCGSPAQPCATVAYVLTQVADGPGDGAEDMLCLHGRFAEGLIKPGFGGLAGTVALPPRGSQQLPFDKSKDPAIIAGWDHDGDRQYPPFDKDDLAELAGAGQARALQFDAKSDDFEIAHLTFAGYGTETESRDSGLVQFGPGPGEVDRIHFHDLYLLGLNEERVISSEVSTFDLFPGKALLRHLWVENVWAPRSGGWFVRGSGADSGPDMGPYRFEKISHSARGCDFSTCENGAAMTAFLLWGKISGIEILDSYFDADVKGWEPKPKGGPQGASFATVAQCSRDWTIRNNEIRDYKVFVKLQGYMEDYCDDANARPVEQIRIDRNFFHNDYAPWAAGDVAIYLSEGGDDPGEVVGEVSITGNLIRSSVGLEACWWLRGGNGAAAPPGQVVIAGNTCAIDANRHAALVVGNVEGPDPAFPRQKIRYANNLVSGLGANDFNAIFTYTPAGLALEGNVWDPAGGFSWGKMPLADFAAWQQESGDRNSRSCTPTFAAPEKAVLAADDTCARDIEAGAPAGRE
jgi:hypothetical protein